ncbi:hypothetical protein OUZ56_006479 [Daphnia magna]|uniref:Uncharacterized protein n=1 Tax=Daphnia magna TaxID=35525 RepID=A0ABQ9YVS5_9CRUS|nr:hypothetical protein OUZ56_006479 [Daphnia magna]
MTNLFILRKPIEENLDFFFPDYINTIIKRAEFVNKLIVGSPANPIRGYANIRSHLLPFTFHYFENQIASTEYKNPNRKALISAGAMALIADCSSMLQNDLNNKSFIHANTSICSERVHLLRSYTK